MRSILRLFCAVLLVASSGCMNPRIQANIAQNLNDIADELNAQRQDMSLLQEQIDSLKLAMAQKDSVIKRLINITGLPPGTEPSDAVDAISKPDSSSVANRAQETDRRYLGRMDQPEHRLRRRAP